MGRRRTVTGELSVFVAALSLCCGIASCQREKRQFEPPAQSQAPQITQSALRPGAQAAQEPVSNVSEERAYDVNEAKRFYTLYNCSGCHANGGGAIGPPLMDDTWIYGSTPANVFASIMEGRPNGMPSFRNKVPESQAWQLAAYVRSMSGQLSKDVSPGRNDDMMPHKSEQASEKKKPQQSTEPK